MTGADDRLWREIATIQGVGLIRALAAALMETLPETCKEGQLARRIERAAADILEAAAGPGPDPRPLAATGGPK